MAWDYQELAKQLNITGRLSGRQLVGKCPMHHDNNPSFSLNIDSGKYTCFAGCGSGNFEHLIMKLQGGTLTEAKDWMLQSAALVPVRNPGSVSKTIDTPDLRWMQQWSRCWRDELPQWWFDRGLTWESAEEWDIRWDPEFQQILIPYKENKYGELLGIVRRNFAGGPKYQNSPGLPRSKYLYGLAQAFAPLILVVEGALDCIWLQQCGFIPVAALLGLNMSEEHIRLLHGFGEVCLALDNDQAGMDAADSITTRLMKAGRPLSQITRLALPEGRKDVSECDKQELAYAFENRRQ